MSTFHKLLFAIALLVTVGCASADNRLYSSKSQTAEEIAATRKKSAEFLSEMADRRQLMYEQAKLASEKASTSELRSNAREMVNEQQQLLENIRTVAKEDGVQLPTKLSVRSSDEMRDLQKYVGPSFDERFVTMTVTRHEQDIAEFRKAVLDSNNSYTPAVQTFAVQKLPVLEARVERVKNIEVADNRRASDKRPIPADRARAF